MSSASLTGFTIPIKCIILFYFSGTVLGVILILAALE